MAVSGTALTVPKQPQRPAPDDSLRSVSISVAVLRCFTEHSVLGPTQVAGQLGIAKSTASRMLSALAAGGLLDRDSNGRYRLSLSLWTYGRLAVDRQPVRALARPLLLSLADTLHEVVQLGVPDAGHVLYVERLGAGTSATLAGEVMRRMPAYSSSAGRVMAANDPDLLRDLWQVARVRNTPYTVVDGQRLGRILGTARSQGWVSSRDEVEVGITSVAAPVLVQRAGRTRAVAALSCVGPTAHLAGPRKPFFVAGIVRAARALSAELSRQS